MTIETAKQKKTRNVVPYSRFLRACDAVDMEASKMAIEIGYTDSACYKWTEDNELPKYAALAAEAIVAKTFTLRLLVVTPANKQQYDAIKGVMTSMGIDFVEPSLEK